MLAQRGILVAVLVFAWGARAQEPPAVSPEATRALVHRLYLEELGRKPDKDGLETHTAHLLAGRDEAWLRSVLQNSPEYQERRAAKSQARTAQQQRRVRHAKITAGLLLLAGLLYWGSKRYPRAARSAAKWSAILLISLGLGEVALRVAHRIRPFYFFYDDSYNRYRGQPGVEYAGHALNSHGFRDVEHSATRTAAKRVLGIGDSFAFGVVPYPANYHTLLEEQLAARGLDTEVINMGIPCIGPREYRDLLVREGLALAPDLVLLSVFAGNDYVEAAAGAATRRPWYEASYVAALLHYLIRVQPHVEGRDIQGEGAYQDDAATFSEAAFLRIERERSYVCRTHPRVVRELDAVMGYLCEIRDLCQRRRIDLLVVLIPDEMQVNPELQTALAGATPNEDWDWSQPTRLLAEALAGEGILFVDLYEPFAAASRTQRLYRLRDTHWNMAGNRLAARTLGEAVEAVLR